MTFRNPVSQTLRQVEAASLEITDRVNETSELVAIALLAVTALSLVALIVGVAALNQVSREH